MARKKKKRRLGRPSICVCGGPRIYSECCKPFHRGELPETPELLMKSRYTAYAKGLVDYIIETTDPDGEQWEHDREAWRASIERFSGEFEFGGVEIVSHSAEGDRGTVHFRAQLSADGRDASFEEVSEFRRVDGQWLYSSGRQK